MKRGERVYVACRVLSEPDRLGKVFVRGESPLDQRVPSSDVIPADVIEGLAEALGGLDAISALACIAEPPCEKCTPCRAVAALAAWAAVKKEGT